MQVFPDDLIHRRSCTRSYRSHAGDVRVMGGAVHVRPGARVFGDVVAFGGDIRVDDDGRIDGSVKVAGGAVRRGDKAIIGGDVKGEVR